MDYTEIIVFSGQDILLPRVAAGHDTFAEPAPPIAEPAKVSADPAKVSAEPGKVSAGPAKASAEPAEVSADSGKVSAGPAKASADPAEVSAEPAKVSADPAKVSAGPALPAAGLEIPPSALRRGFEWAGKRYSAVLLDEVAAAATGLERVPLRQALGMFQEEALRPAIKAAAIVNWLAGAIHCGACGAPLVDDDHDSSGRRCTSCGRVHFPRISPAVIVLVRRGDEALFARNARFPGGRFGLVAGFVDPGESVEEAVAREVREETGIEIEGLRYLRSQSWPFPDSLMLAFTARWASGEARPDGKEIVELVWRRADDLPSIPPSGSVARWLVDEFVRGAI